MKFLASALLLLFAFSLASAFAFNDEQFNGRVVALAKNPRNESVQWEKVHSNDHIRGETDAA